MPRSEQEAFRSLGIDSASSTQEIKAAYRELAKKHHPDVNPGDTSAVERFKRITAAYTQALLASAKRDREGGHTAAGSSSSSSRPQPAYTTRSSSGPVDPKRYNVREWEKSHYGMHGGNGMGLDQQSQHVRNLQRQMRAQQKYAAAAREARRAGGGGQVSLAYWLVTSVAACSLVWTMVYSTNKNNPKLHAATQARRRN